MVGGLERVYEINRNFRNEGVSTRHNPEFTMLELYEAYATYHQIMDLTEQVIRDTAQSVLGTTQVNWDGAAIDLAPAFRRWRMDEAVRHHNPQISAADCTDRDALLAHCERLKIKVKPSYGWGKLLLEIFEATVEHTLVQPTFITDHPVEVSPLARSSDTEPGYTDRFELFINGKELANSFSSSMTRKTRPRGSRRRCRPRTVATTKRCITTPTTSVRWSTAWRRPVAWVSASTAW